MATSEAKPTLADRAQEPCPCGSGKQLAACCGPIIAGEPARTALDLMRSRYTAYATTSMDHIVATHDPETRGDLDVDAASKWAVETQWKGLSINKTEAGGADDTEGVVDFTIEGVTQKIPFTQRQRSNFRKIDGRWFYVDGKMINEPVKKAATPGRNDPCPCGSGQKYKKCHGA
jgi:SEC-C motif-containing protein